MPLPVIAQCHDQQFGAFGDALDLQLQELTNAYSLLKGRENDDLITRRVIKTFEDGVKRSSTEDQEFEDYKKMLEVLLVFELS